MTVADQQDNMTIRLERLFVALLVSVDDEIDF